MEEFKQSSRFTVDPNNLSCLQILNLTTRIGKGNNKTKFIKLTNGYQVKSESNKYEVVSDEK